MSGGIKRRNLDESLIQWIMNEAGLGPGIGEIRYVAPETSGTSQYRTQLEHMGISSGSIFTLPSLGFAALEANRNDVLLLSPGTYTEPETLSWSKAQTHMLGTGNPTWRQGGKIRIQTTVEAATAAVDVTASGVHFGGFNISNNGAFTACVTALRMSSTYFGAKKLDLRGSLQGTTAALTTPSSLEFADGSSLGFASTFEDCNIGTGSGTARTGASGVILFKSSNTGPAYVEFKNCRILSISGGTGTHMVRAESVLSYDRYILFEDCLFNNFSLAQAYPLAAAFYNASASSGAGWFLLKNCMAAGITEWQTMDQGNEVVLADMPIVGDGGGLGVQPTNTAGN